MAEPQGGLTFVLDENSKGLRDALLASRAVARDRLKLLPEVGIPDGTLDADMLRELGQRGRFILVARDGRMLEPMLQRQAWRASKVTLFLLAKHWGGLPLSEMTRRLLFLWPKLVDHAEQGGEGVAWRVSPVIPAPGSGAFRLVTGRRDEASSGADVPAM